MKSYREKLNSITEMGCLSEGYAIATQKIGLVFQQNVVFRTTSFLSRNFSGVCDP